MQYFRSQHRIKLLKMHSTNWLLRPASSVHHCEGAFHEQRKNEEKATT